MRTTGHGISAGIGKLGAFIGYFLFPVLQASLGLRGTLLLTAAVAVAGFALTLVLPEPAGRSLEDIAISAARDERQVPADSRSAISPITFPSPLSGWGACRAGRVRGSGDEVSSGSR